MLTAMVIVFLVGYLMIALEPSSKDKQGGNGFAYWYYLMGYVHVRGPVFHPEGLSRGIQLVLGIVPLFGFFNV